MVQKRKNDKALVNHVNVMHVIRDTIAKLKWTDNSLKSRQDQSIEKASPTEQHKMGALALIQKCFFLFAISSVIFCCRPEQCSFCNLQLVFH
jgi:hypothetical protein